MKSIGDDVGQGNRSISTLTMLERLEEMRKTQPRRNRGQIPMEQVTEALKYQREYQRHSTDFQAHAITDCSESLDKLRNEKREARERRGMTWEDHLASSIRTEAVAKANINAKKLAQECAMLAQLKTDFDKWNMAIDLRFCTYLATTLAHSTPDLRREYFATKTKSGHTPLHRACKTKCAHVVQLLLDWDADITVRDDADKTVVHWAAEYGTLPVFKTLQEHLTKMMIAPEDFLCHVDRNGASILHLAASNGHVEIVSAILETLSSSPRLSMLVNLPTTRDQETPIHLAAHKGHVEVLTHLINCGSACVSVRNARGANALHLALKQTFNIDNLVRVFMDLVSTNEIFEAIEEESGYNSLHTAIIKKFRTVALAIIQNKRCSLNVAIQSGSGWSPLHLAVLNREIEIVEALLNGDTMVDMVDNDGQTPLLLACLGGQLRMITLLLSVGANPLHQNRQAHSPLHYLASFCHDQSVLIDIIERGADVNAKSMKLNTPLHFAAMNGNKTATKILLEYGANVNAINEDKRSVLYLAKKWGHQEVEDLVRPPDEREEEDDTNRGRTRSEGASIRPNIKRMPASPIVRRGARHIVYMSTRSPEKRGHGRSNTKSEDVDTDSEDDDFEDYLDDDDEMILPPTTPWPEGFLPFGLQSVQSSDQLASPSNQPHISIIQERFTGHPREKLMVKTTRSPLKPVILPRGQKHHHTRHNHHDLESAAREILDNTTQNNHLTKFTHRLLTNPVHIPWEMTIPVTIGETNVFTNEQERVHALQRKIKPSIRTNIGLLRDHLTHSEHHVWPRYSDSSKRYMFKS